jgi:hypothetical protein
MRAVRGLVVVAASFLLLAACSESSPDLEETRDWLVREVGFTDTQAQCVLDQVWALDELDDDDLRDELAEENPDLDDDDETRLAAIVRSCTIGN